MPLETFFTVSEQTTLFLYSILLGAALGVIFDVFRILRAFFRHGSVLIMLEDAFFVFLWGASLVVFSLALARGEVRLFYLIGSLLGFTLYILTLGRAIVLAAKAVAGAVNRFISRIYGMFVPPIRHFFVVLYQRIKPVFVNVYLIFMKPSQIRKNSLKKRNEVVYNKSMNLSAPRDRCVKSKKKPKKRKSYGEGCERIEKDRGKKTTEGNAFGEHD